MKNDLSVQEVVAAVSKATGIGVDDIMKRDRHRNIADSRMVVYFLLHTLYGMNFCAIGRKMHRTHAAIRYGVLQVGFWLDETKPRDKHTKDNCNIVKQVIKQLKP